MSTVRLLKGCELPIRAFSGPTENCNSRSSPKRKLRRTCEDPIRSNKTPEQQMNRNNSAAHSLLESSPAQARPCHCRVPGNIFIITDAGHKILRTRYAEAAAKKTSRELYDRIAKQRKQRNDYTAGPRLRTALFSPIFCK